MQHEILLYSEAPNQCDISIYPSLNCEGVIPYHLLNWVEKYGTLKIPTASQILETVSFVSLLL